MLRFERWFVLTLFLLLGHSAAGDPLTVVSWGGAYERSQRIAYFEPYSAVTGIGIEVERYGGGLQELRRQVETGEVRWDLVDMLLAENLAACEQGLLLRIDHATLPPAPDGMPATADFLPGSLSECGAPQVVSSLVLAYHADAFPGEKPARVRDLFDLERFPGKRALQRSPMANLEWALLSYGVPRQELYSLLSTERGLRLAFERLDVLREHIVWWEEMTEPARLLDAGEVTMASGYNGRFFDAMVDGVGIVIIWDGQLLDYSVWGIPHGNPHPERALDFVRFATATPQLTEQARHIAYGPARRSAAARVLRHTASGLDIRPHLPTYPPHLAVAIHKDHAWYARTQERLKQRFEEWLRKGR